MTFLILDAGVSVYDDGSTVVTVSGVIFMGTVGVAAAGGGAADEVMVVEAGTDEVVVDVAAATGADRRAAHPSLPKN